MKKKEDDGNKKGEDEKKETGEETPR